MSPVIFTDPGTSAKKQHSKKKHREAKQDCTVKAAEPLYENLSPDQEPTAQSPEEPTKTILPDPSVAVGGEQQVEHAPSADDTAPKDAQPADEPPDQIAGKKDKLHSDLKPGEVMIPPDHRSIRAMKDEHDDERDQWFGLLGVYPPFLQKYRTPRCALTVLCLVCFTRSFSMNGVMMVVLPSLERRYRMKSYESGMVLSSNDVASCLAMLPVSFLATQRHKPRFVGSGTAIMGLGNLVVAMAHFLSPPYSLAGAGSDTCPELHLEQFQKIGSSLIFTDGARCAGPIVLVGGGFGAVIGGALVSRWNLDYAGMMRLCMYNSCFSWFGVLTYLVNCQENTYATPEGFVGAP
ncbi:hypothetical protein V5799_029289, partial [Amblyomma americanum]